MIEYDSQKIRKFWPKFRSKIILFLAIFQIFSLLLVAGLLSLLIDVDPMSPSFWIALAIFGLVNGLLLVVSHLFISKPISELFRLISDISSGSSGHTTLPDVSSKLHQKSGFSEVLKFIYSLDSKPKNNNEKAINEEILEILENGQVGVLVLNKKNQIMYKSQTVPQIKNLIFTNQPLISDWLDKSRESKIRDDFSWKRVPNDTAENEDRNIYDIYGHYKKDAPADVVLFFVDKTKSYMPDEDDLNFIAFAAHELRGPITIIRGYLDVLSTELKDTITPQQSELFKRLLVSSNKLSGYINNILNVSRFDRNHFAFELSEHSVKDLINSVREDAELRAVSQNRMLEINIEEDLPTIGADLSSMSEVLINLIDNGIKYSNEGGLVKVSAVKAGDYVDIHVQDFGIGIPNNVLKNLFQKFYRSHRSRETVAGTGIGLYISRAIIEGHSGQISVKSVEGEGSTFTITLPTYAIISDKLLDKNSGVIKQPGGGWIKNHGKVST